jgi:hypothetical protein
VVVLRMRHEGALRLVGVLQEKRDEGGRHAGTLGSLVTGRRSIEWMMRWMWWVGGPIAYPVPSFRASLTVCGGVVVVVTGRGGES